MIRGVSQVGKTHVECYKIYSITFGHNEKQIYNLPLLALKCFWNKCDEQTQGMYVTSYELQHLPVPMSPHNKLGW